jgi:hypothetical protein
MNDNDKNNLLFILSLDSKSLNDWYIQADEDDRLYADELLEQAHLIVIDAAVAKLPRFKEAKKVLAQFAI